MTRLPYLRLLGGARVDADAEQTPIRGRAAHRRRLGLLALLAASPGARLSRERILFYLWEERDSEVGRKHLSEALHVIRRELGEAVLVAVGDDVRLDTAVLGADVVDFRSAVAASDFERAVSLYGGAFLDGWYVREAPAFEEWAESLRAELAGEYVRARESLAEAAERNGDWAASAEHWRILTRISPESARPVLALARALTRRGDRAAALKALSSHIKRLDEDGLPVEEEIRSAAAALRNGSQRMSPLSELPTESTPTGPTHDPSSPELESAAAAPAKASSTRRPWLIAAAVSLLVLALGGMLSRPATPTAGQGPNDGPPRVAVLYFKHDPRDDVGHLADAFTEKLIDELGSVPQLRVISRTGALRFRNQDSLPADSIAELLGANLIVEGRVARAGDRVRVTVSLVDAEALTLIGPSRTVERATGDELLFALQDDVAAALAILLRRQLGTEIRLVGPRVQTSNGRAQELLARGDQALNSAQSLVAFGTVADLPAAERTLESADSAFAAASRTDPRWRAPRLARGWVARSRARLESGAERLALLQRAAGFADSLLSVDSLDAEALELRGVARWMAATRFVPPTTADSLTRLAAQDLRQAIRLDSSRVVAAAQFAQLRRVTGTDAGARAEAIALARLAYERDPFLAHAEGAISQLYRAWYAAGNADSARAWCGRGRIIAPGDWNFVECQLALMRLQLNRASPAEAWALVARLEAMDPAEKAEVNGNAYSPVYRRLVAAAVSAAAGERDSARAVLARALRDVDSDADRRVDVKFDAALVRFALGERQAALQSLREYLERHPTYRSAVLGDPALVRFGVDSASLAATRR